jgi:hypothetical protein
MEGVVKLGTIAIDRDMHLVFQVNLEAFERRYMYRFKFKIKQESPTIMELSTGIDRSFNLIQRYHGRGASIEGGPPGRVQLGTISVIKGDLLEYASNPDRVEQ